MPLLSEFERKAWDARTKANEHAPRTALLAAADAIEAGEYPYVAHVIVVIVEDGEAGCRVSTVQAGSIGSMAVEGTMARALHQLIESATR